MSTKHLMQSGRLFLKRPRSVTVGLGIAGTIAALGILVGCGMLFGYTSIYVGLTSFLVLPPTDHHVQQGLIILIQNIIFLIAVGRALKPAQIPRYITIGLSGLTGVFWAIEKLSGNASLGSLFAILAVSIVALLPAFLLMSSSASDYYGD